MSFLEAHCSDHFNKDVDMIWPDGHSIVLLTLTTWHPISMGVASFHILYTCIIEATTVQVKVMPHHPHILRSWMGARLDITLTKDAPLYRVLYTS